MSHDLLTPGGKFKFDTKFHPLILFNLEAVNYAW